MRIPSIRALVGPIDTSGLGFHFYPEDDREYGRAWERHQTAIEDAPGWVRPMLENPHASVRAVGAMVTIAGTVIREISGYSKQG